MHSIPNTISLSIHNSPIPSSFLLPFLHLPSSIPHFPSLSPSLHLSLIPPSSLPLSPSLPLSLSLSFPPFFHLFIHQSSLPFPFPFIHQFIHPLTLLHFTNDSLSIYAFIQKHQIVKKHLISKPCISALISPGM